MSQFKTGQAKVLAATPNKVVLTGATTTGNIAVGNLYKFQGENVFYTVASIVDSASFTLSANYSGSKAFDTYYDYAVVVDFTPNQSFPLLRPGDVDIRDVYSRALNSIDAMIAGHKTIAGYTELIQADVDGNIALGLRGKSLTQSADIFTVEKSDATKLFRVLPGGGVVISGVGPHAIGGAPSANYQFMFTGAWSRHVGLSILSMISPPDGALTGRLLDVAGSINAPAGFDAYGAYIGPTLNKAASGIHALFAGLMINVPVIGVGASTVTEAASLYVVDAPSVGTNRYAVHVPLGNVRLDGRTFFGHNVAGGSAVGELVLANAKYLCGLNLVADTTYKLIGIDAANKVSIDPDGLGIILSAGGGDIKWGRAVVALGGGAAATLGTIGGSGPTAAAQASWVRVITSTGATGFMALWT